MSSKLSALTDLAGGQVPTDLAYIVDLSAGANGSKKSTLNDFLEQITKNITDAVVKGINGSGTNGAGADLGLSGGKGTGNAIPGQVVVRYPLIGASGSTLQSLSANAYPAETTLYTNTNAGTSINNTVVETSLFTGLTGSAGSTNSIEGGITRSGTHYKVRIVGNVQTTGTPTMQVRAKLGSVTIADTTAAGITTAGGKFWIDLDILINTIGATGTVTAFLRFDFSSGNSGGVTIATLNGANGGAVVDLTAAQTLDITIQWGTASASNLIQVFDLNITRSH